MKTIQGIYLIEKIQATDDNDKRQYYIGMSNTNKLLEKLV